MSDRMPEPSTNRDENAHPATSTGIEDDPGTAGGTDSLFDDESYTPPPPSGEEWDDIPPPPEDTEASAEAYGLGPDAWSDLPPDLGGPTPPMPDEFPPPPDEAFSTPDRTFDRAAEHGRPGPGGKRTPVDPEMTAKVIDTIRSAFAATHERPGEEVVDLVQYVIGSPGPMQYLSPEQTRNFKRVAEVLTSVARDNTDAEFNLFEIADLEAAHPRVVSEVATIRDRHNSNDVPANPTSMWRALCDQVQKLAASKGAKTLIDAINEDLPAEELMKLYSDLEPPTTQRTVQNATFSQTAGAWEKQDAAAEAERPLYRISSGYRTWDYVFTLKDAYGKPAEPLGCWAPGEFHAVAAGTGHGKSALSRRVITAAAEDLVTGWGHEHAKVLIAITEEAPKIVYRAAGLAEGQPFHHLRDNIVIADVGASRRRFVQAVWDLVIEAYHLAKKTGRSIVDCGLPEFIVLDYIGGIVEAGEGGDTTAIENTANLIMRGLCGWRIQEMEQFSGESFAEYAGMSWPSGMENFKPAVLTFVQLRKLTRPEFYNPETKGMSPADFTVEKADGSPGWSVRAGDYVVPERSEIRGSGVLQNHLTSLSVAHRSRPQNNDKIIDPVTHKMRLECDRARIIFLKTRNSADMPFVPMRFDSNPEGLRGQYYDLLTEKAIAHGRVKPLPSYTQAGDPILPARPVKSPFEGVVY